MLCKIMGWIQLARNNVHWRAAVNAGEKFRSPSKENNLLASWATATFSSGILFNELVNQSGTLDSD
jgi:hypothetical protein